jgi:hypothetical protein
MAAINVTKNATAKTTAIAKATAAAIAKARAKADPYGMTTKRGNCKNDCIGIAVAIAVVGLS